MQYTVVTGDIYILGIYIYWGYIYTRVQKWKSLGIYIYWGYIYKLAPQARKFLRKIAKILDSSQLKLIFC